MSVRVRVRSHRMTPGALEKVRDSQKVREALEVFADALREEAGEAIHERMRSGAWHTSKNARYAYFRTWSKYRYGSSRARTRSGSRFTGSRTLRTNDPDYRLPQSLDVRDTVELLKFNFLARALRKQAVRQDDGSWMVGPRKHLRDNAGTMAGLEGVYDVSSAMERISEIYAEAYRLQTSEPDAQTGVEKARAYRRQAAEDFLAGSHEHTRFFQETRMGQRYLRSAEIAALRHSRNDVLLDPNSAYNEDLGRYELGILEKRREAYDKIRGKILRRDRKIPTLLPTGSFSWGYETGTLARSWRDARMSVERKGRGYQMVLAASEKADGRNPSPLRLTQYLKRNIEKQGGRSGLLTRRLAQEAVRSALKRVKSRWARLGIRLRAGKGGS